jgi:penicillin-binding protein-related factor A (putative recombinase)
VSRSRSYARRASEIVRAADPAAQIAGARARRAGRSLEASINAVNRWYDEQGEAAIEKVNAPTEGWGESLRMLPSNVDYNGTWKPASGSIGLLERGRIGIAFDTKSVTKCASFGVDHLPKGAKAVENRARFMNQVRYLKNLRERHGYVAFFLLYCDELETVWVCEQLDALSVGQSVKIRTKQRVNGKTEVMCHLPFLKHPNLLALAAAPNHARGGRPFLDYLSLLR